MATSDKNDQDRQQPTESAEKKWRGKVDDIAKRNDELQRAARKVRTAREQIEVAKRRERDLH